jgi:hypothetical protein
VKRGERTIHYIVGGQHGVIEEPPPKSDTAVFTNTAHGLCDGAALARFGFKNGSKVIQGQYKTLSGKNLQRPRPPDSQPLVQVRGDKLDL